MSDNATLDILTLDVADDRPWAAFAACVGEFGPKFFPQTRADERIALAICRTCPVQAECLDHAIEHKERHGVWGGTTERERRAMFRGS